jgi:hypothetical protein
MHVNGKRQMCQSTLKWLQAKAFFSFLRGLLKEANSNGKSWVVVGGLATPEALPPLAAKRSLLETNLTPS